MPQRPTIEDGVSHVEQDLAELKSQVEPLRPNGNLAETDSPRSANLWLDGAGMFRDDPLFDDWQRAIAEHRRGADRATDAP